MKGTVCLYSPAMALGRVFLQAGPSHRRVDLAVNAASTVVVAARGQRSFSLLAVPQFLAPQPLLLASSTASITSPAWAFSQLVQRPSSSRTYAVRRGGGGGPRGRGGSSNPQAGSKRSRLPRDDEITSEFVILIQPDGTLGQPVYTDQVLSKMNLRTDSLVVVAMPRGKDPEEGEEGRQKPASKAPPEHPICKIVDRIAERKAQAEKLKEQRKQAVKSKELEINWAIDAHDLEHRMEKLREFLEKGFQVEVRLLRKSKGKKKRATQDEAQDVLRRIKEAAAEVEGTREVKRTEGELLRTMKLYLEGPTNRKPSAGKTEESETADAEREGQREKADEGDVLCRVHGRVFA